MISGRPTKSVKPKFNEKGQVVCLHCPFFELNLPCGEAGIPCPTRGTYSQACALAEAMVGS